MTGFQYDFLTMQDHFFELGRTQPELDRTTRMKMMIKLLYRNHIQDEDGYDVAEAAFIRGRESITCANS